ncbi:SURF1 family cytochrome oxidase biogenesis protein [uncultured Erythrobacter sp.]|uniref:SURF1 family cytochrome oxidase biogenesis protein n=1 Tax=uncultured Erythrobacter sp. TaxID=263913 RepID=UPI0026254037|nr:SURF1 family cytochrome oxidase biogenesis protein [uncultured Erythrobacter sp.]
MIRQFLVIPTILVVAAAGVMVWLGFWQLGRADEKAALMALYDANLEKPTLQDFRPFSDDDDPLSSRKFHETRFDDMLFRRVEMPCPNPGQWSAVAGRNNRGQTGYVHKFVCESIENDFFTGEEIGVRAFATIGWSSAPARPHWKGGNVEGLLARSGDGVQVFASEPLADLQPLAKPDPNDLPNNHLAYAGQWFFFAITALVIYFLAIRTKLAKRD